MMRALRAKTGTAATLRGQPGSGGPSIIDTFESGGAPAKDKDPTKNDEASCPLCQAFASAGAFVTPAAAAVLLPAFSVSIIDVVVHATTTSSAVTHSWRGRAPPLG
jgi:hypothetical protein